jgi:hypothetical protein
MRTTYITVLLMRKISTNNRFAHAHNFSFADAHDNTLYAKYRFILTPKFTNVEDYVSHTADTTITLPLVLLTHLAAV